VAVGRDDVARRTGRPSSCSIVTTGSRDVDAGDAPALEDGATPDRAGAIRRRAPAIEVEPRGDHGVMTVAGEAGAR
jgi:hypothetical protein